MSKKKSLSGKKFFFMSLISSVGIWLVVSLFFLWISKSHEQANNLRNEVLSLSSQENEIRLLAREIHSLGEDVNAPDKFFIGSSQEEIVSFIEMVESLAFNLGIDLDTESVEVSEYTDKSKARNFEFLKISLSTKANWQDTFRFATILEGLPYKLMIDRLDLNTFIVKIEEEEIQKQWTGEFLFRVAKLKSIEDENTN